MTKTNVPRLRFKGFNGEWKNRKLNDIGSIFGGLTGKTKEDFGHGDSSYLTYLNINRKFVSDISCTESVDIGADEKQNLIKRNDVLFTISSETPEEVGLSSTWIDDCSTYLNSFSFGYRFKNETDGYYTAALFRSRTARQKIFPLAQGISRYNLSKSNFLKLTFDFAEFPEQQKIGSFFSKIDNLIDLQSQKLEQLKKLKQGYLQKMFPQDGESIPRLRFSGFSGEWKEDKIENLYTVGRGLVLSKNNISAEQTKNNPFPVYSSQTKDNGLLGYYSEYLYENAITWTTDGANAGTVNYRKGKFYSTNVNGVLSSDEGYCNLMMSNAINNVAFKYVSHVGNPKLMNNTMKDIKIKYPSKSEQNKISDFLSKLDQMINEQSNKIDALKQQKKAYLQKMFI